MPFEIDDGQVPHGLTGRGFVLRPLVEGDAVLDHAALMASKEELRQWEQSTWPEDDFTVEANRADLARHERLHVEGRAFTYTVVDPSETECLGCVYLFPTDAAFLAAAEVTPVADDRWEDVDAVVYHWVRSDRHDSGLASEVLAALRTWLVDVWDFRRPVLVTSDLYVRQVALVTATDLELRFVVAEPGKPGRFLAYG